MSVKIIKTFADWQQHRTEWQEIFESSSNHTPFQSADWLMSWWQHLGGGDLFVLQVQDEAGATLGYAPFFMRKRYYGLPIRHLAFIGVKRTDYLDFVIRDGQEEAFFDALLPWLADSKRQFKFVELRDMPDSSRNLPILTNAIGRFLPIYTMESSRICVAVPLTADWDSFLQTLGKRTRKDVGYDRRYIAKRHKTELVAYRNGQDVKKGYQDLVEIYNSRWQDEKGATRYSEGAAAKFEAQVCDLLSKRGDYRLWVLYADDKPVAGVSGYERNNKLFADVYAHSPAFHKLSVGNIVLGHAIEQSIAGGLREFDLSRGEEPYKFRWNGQEKRNFHIKLFSSHGALAAAAFAENAYLRATQSEGLQKLYSKYRKWRFGTD